MAKATAVQMATLDLKAHTATKMRARAQTLTAVRAAIEADDAAFREPASSLA